MHCHVYVLELYSYGRAASVSMVIMEVGMARCLCDHKGFRRMIIDKRLREKPREELEAIIGSKNLWFKDGIINRRNMIIWRSV